MLASRTPARLAVVALSGALALTACTSRQSPQQSPRNVHTSSGAPANESSSLSAPSGSPSGSLSKALDAVTAQSLATRARCSGFAADALPKTLTAGHCTLRGQRVQLATFASATERDAYVALTRRTKPKAPAVVGTTWAAVALSSGASASALSSFGGRTA